MKVKFDNHNEKIAATCLLLSVAEADEILEEGEIQTIKDIITDFFKLTTVEAAETVSTSRELLIDSKGLFEFGQILNDQFTHQDKLEFIECVFEVAYADEDLHYLEHHTIKKIANILHIERDEIIAAKAEMETYLN